MNATTHPPIASGVKTGLKTWRPLPPYYACDRCGCPVRSSRQIKAGDPVVCCHCKTPAELRAVQARKEAVA